MRLCRLTIALSLALFTALAAQPASAQRREKRFARPPQGQAKKPKPNAHPTGPPPRQKNNGPNAPRPNANKPQGEAQNPGAARPQGDGRGLAGLPPKWVANLRDMSPGEQERFMQNNQRFQSLPPQRQQQIRQNLRKWNNLTPEERSALRHEESNWEHMSPGQRQHVKNDLLPRWQQMPPGRRMLISGRLHALHQMTPEQQQAALNDPRFMRGLSPDEQSMLRDLNSLRNLPASQ